MYGFIKAIKISKEAKHSLIPLSLYNLYLLDDYCVNIILLKETLIKIGVS
jgi:hypothetical protein